MDLLSDTCIFSDEDFIAVLLPSRGNDALSTPSGHRRPARCLPEKDLLSLFRNRRAARVWFAFRVGPLRAGALAHRIEPAPQVWEVVQILLLALPRNDPWIGSHVGDAVGVADHECAVFEVAIKDPDP